MKWVVPFGVLLAVLAAPGALPVGADLVGRQAPVISREWVRVHSPHFTAAGNAGYAEMRAVLLELEGFRTALVRTLPGLRVAAPRPVTVVVFRDERAFAPFRPLTASGERRETVAGYFLTTPDASYMVVAMHRDMRRTFQHLFHEYTHFVVQQNLGRVPDWFNEGLAEYYSTLRADLAAGRAVIGEPSPSRLATLRDGALLPLRELLTYDASPSTAAPPQRALAFYAQAWAFVHYLLHAEGGRLAPRVGTYLDALRAGLTVDAAVRTAFDISVEELDQRLRGYIRRAGYASRVIEEPSGNAPPRIAREAMRDADVEDLLDRLRSALR